MRYKISYGPDDKRDKWGHTIKAATIHSEYFNKYVEAEKVALQISKEHKKWTVNVFDTQGPVEEDLPDTLWLIVSFEDGIKWTNDNYTKACRLL